MTYIAKPKVHHPSLQKNAIGLTRRDYEGAITTLCAGCGHDSITAAIIQSFWELSIPPYKVAKLSGIGCSSKTPAYFLSTREDHIAPWKSTYRGTQLLGGPKRFVLAASGHIAGVVNHPAKKRRNHWVNTKLPAKAVFHGTIWSSRLAMIYVGTVMRPRSIFSPHIVSLLRLRRLFSRYVLRM